MTMPGFPGLISGQPLNGQQVGNALFQLAPTLPHESPVPLPRVLAKILFPQGFVPFVAAPAPARPAAPLIPPAPAVPAAPAAPPAAARPPAPAVDARGNQILRREPATRKRVLERGTYPAWH